MGSAMKLYDATESRKIALAALRTNHRGYRQIRGRLKTFGTDDRCATGVLAEAMHVHIGTENDYSTSEKLEEILGDPGVTSFIISQNDSSNRSLGQIAELLAKRWNLQ